MRETIFGLHPIWAATGILLLTYAVIMTERINRAIVAGVGACLMIALGALDQEAAIAGVDFNTIMLLAGMMIIVGVSRRSIEVILRHIHAVCRPQSKDADRAAQGAAFRSVS